MTETYGLPPGTAIDYKQLGFPPWVDALCVQCGLDSSTYPNHQTGDRPDIGAAPNPDHLNRGIDWAGPADKMLAFAHWLRSIGPARTLGQYGPYGLEQVIYRHVPTGEDVTYPDFVDYSGDLPDHTDHVHTRVSAPLLYYQAPPSSDLIAALTRAGIDPAMFPLLIGFAVTEGNNPSGVPTLGFTDSQAGTTLDEHAQALAQQLKDREPVAGPFPRQGTPFEQASWLADIVGQQGLPSDWQGNAQPPRADYVNSIVTNMPVQPVPLPEKDDMAGVNADRLNQAVDKILGTYPSRSMFAADNHDVDDGLGFLLNTDANAWNQMMIAGALLGVPYAVQQVQRVARGDFPSGTRVFNDPWLRDLAQQFAQKLLPLCGSLQPGSTQPAPTPTPVPPPPQPQPTPPPTQNPPPQPTPTPPPPPPIHAGPKPVIYTINGFQGDLWQQQPSDTARALADVAWHQPVGYQSGAFPLGVGRDSGANELKRLIREHQAENPGRRFVLCGYSLGAIIACDIFDELRSGDLQDFWPYFVGGVMYGNPRREAHNWTGANTDPGGQGIAGPGNLKQTPPNLRSYVYDWNKDDIYTNCPIGPTGDDMRLVYEVVMLHWNGTILSVLDEVQELLTRTGTAALSIIDAVVRGIGFFADQSPHMQIPIDDGVQFLRQLLTT